LRPRGAGGVRQAAAGRGLVRFHRGADRADRGRSARGARGARPGDGVNGGATKVFALLGRPVHHSLSPAIYNGLFAHHGLDAVYVALDVAPERGPGVVEALRTLGLGGVNLTVPHKAVVVPALDEVGPAVHVAGAANVVVARDGRLVGANTDGDRKSTRL